MRTTKQTIIGAAFGLLCLATPALGDDEPRLGGWWRLVAFYAEDVDTKARAHIYGERPIGYMGVNGEGRFDAWTISGWPKRASSPAEGLWEEIAQAYMEQSDSYRAIFYSGRYQLEEDKLAVRVEKAGYEGWTEYAALNAVWNERPTLTKDLRSFRLERDKQGNEILHIETAPIVNPKGGKIVGTVIWARSHEWDSAPAR